MGFKGILSGVSEMGTTLSKNFSRYAPYYGKSMAKWGVGGAILGGAAAGIQGENVGRGAVRGAIGGAGIRAAGITLQAARGIPLKAMATNAANSKTAKKVMEEAGEQVRKAEKKVGKVLEVGDLTDAEYTRVRQEYRNNPVNYRARNARNQARTEAAAEGYRQEAKNLQRQAQDETFRINSRKFYG